MAKMRLRAYMMGDKTTVKVLMKHPMHTGLRKDKKTGATIPAHFIQEISCEHNGKSVMNISSGPAVSKNPYLSFRVLGCKKGDAIKVSWIDNKGASDSAESKITD